MRFVLVAGLLALLSAGLFSNSSLRDTRVASPSAPSSTPSAVTPPDAIKFNYDDCITSRTCRTFEPYVLQRELLLDRDEPIPLADYVKREANEGDPNSANRYGQWLIEMDNPRAAETYLMIAAAAGFLDAHSALAKLKSDRGSRTDRIEAWAHLRTVEREDGALDHALFERLDATLSDEDRAKAEDAAWQFRDLMRRTRNDIERLKD